ncbi:phage portal protein [Hansschlegelia zhihuaiae]|uniref:Phage portal protein n=1 Tax=Hansschlegelia zhihuaiae TaxID=405005 RepID=A0A4Q0MNJ4_9HYPH|nr:phage portal protein [Hansschlegelia zhihuaiae]RXF75461.1 phage portal protein [Hansschlegelia zhihuaiae]
MRLDLGRLLGWRPSRKSAPLGAVVALHACGRPVWTSRDPATLAREGYQRNPVVHRAVRMVAEAAGGVPLTLAEGERELDRHPLADLLARPNARQGQAGLVETLVSHLLVAGDAYVEAVSLDGAPRELHALRPDRMRLEAGPDGWPEAYLYRVGAEAVRYDQRAEPIPPILHLSLFNPLDDHFGLSPLEPAAAAVDLHNAASAWNKALLDNAARPSGALVYKGPEGGGLSDDQVERLKEELEAQFSGAANAGRPLLLDGGLDWRPMSLTPQEMDFLSAKNSAAREIALAFGVPPMLLGIPGDATYANYAQANVALWRQTVIPLLSRIAQSVATWLSPAYGAELTLKPDLDAVEALAEERESLWRRVSAAEFLTDDEKRAAVGYGARGG